MRKDSISGIRLTNKTQLPAFRNPQISKMYGRTVIIEVRNFPSYLTGTIEGYLQGLKKAREFARMELIAPHRLSFKPMPHQIEVAKRAIYDMGTRAILADEVGLGKTIEAGLILKEKIIRNEVEKALILTPASLTEQWKVEMLEKFDLDFKIATEIEDFENDFIISSIHLAKREKYRESIISHNWDMLIVDEAHHAKNPSTQNYRFLRSINSKFILLLTATPISNSLKELYYLADLLRPGMFGTYREFEAKYFRDKKGREVENKSELQIKLESIMIRHRRRDVFVDFTERVVKTYLADLSGSEREMYDSIIEFLRDEENKLRVIAYAKAATSSPMTVAKMAWKALKSEGKLRSRNHLLRIYRAAMDSHFSKLSLLLRVAEKIESGVIFTTYLETMRGIEKALKNEGFVTHTFHGGMNREMKRKVIRDFMEQGGLLIATDSGGEGLNLQFANTMVNFDLPWNPMKVEQRIGRIHRIGQERDVYVVNLAYRDTIEEHVLEILDKKINLFRSVVGEIDAILGSLEKNFESIVAEILMTSRSHEEINNSLERLGDEMEKLKSRYENIEKLNDTVFSQFNLAVYGGA